MNTRIDRRQLAIDLCARSSCRTKMAAVCSDKNGIFSWGWNSMGPSGFGTHAEENAILRSNRKRLIGCTVSVAGYRNPLRYVLSCPCHERCWPLLKRVGVKTIEFVHPDGHWTFYRL